MTSEGEHMCRYGRACVEWVRVLVDGFDFSCLPGFVKEGLEGAVETQDGEPFLAEAGLYPVALLGGGCFWSEVDVCCSVLVGDRAGVG